MTDLYLDLIDRLQET